MTKIDRLAKELASLSPEDRNMVLTIARRPAPQAIPMDKKPLTWKRLHEVRALTHLGGDALADCAQLYDA